MSQFLHMTASLLDVVEEAGGNADYDFFRYVITRYEPTDGPQGQIVGLLTKPFWRTRPHNFDPEIHRNIGCRSDKTNAL